MEKTVLNFSLVESNQEIPEAVDGPILDQSDIDNALEFSDDDEPNLNPGAFERILDNGAFGSIWRICGDKGLIPDGLLWIEDDTATGREYLPKDLDINLYVTESSSALVPVVRDMCERSDIKLNIYQYDRDKEEWSLSDHQSEILQQKYDTAAIRDTLQKRTTPDCSPRERTTLDCSLVESNREIPEAVDGPIISQYYINNALKLPDDATLDYELGEPTLGYGAFDNALVCGAFDSVFNICIANKGFTTTNFPKVDINLYVTEFSSALVPVVGDMCEYNDINLNIYQYDRDKEEWSLSDRQQSEILQEKFDTAAIRDTLQKRTTLNFSLVESSNEIPEAVNGPIIHRYDIDQALKDPVDAEHTLDCGTFNNVWNICYNRGLTYTDYWYDGDDMTPVYLAKDLNLNLYVTESSSALVPVVRDMCESNDVNLHIYEYNEDSGKWALSDRQSEILQEKYDINAIRATLQNIKSRSGKDVLKDNNKDRKEPSLSNRSPEPLQEKLSRATTNASLRKEKSQSGKETSKNNPKKGNSPARTDR